MANVYEAYIVDSRSWERDKNGRPIWTHRLIDTGVFTNKRDMESWARKHKVFGARCYVYLSGSNKLYDDFKISHGKIMKKSGFAFSIFKNKRPTTVVRR